MITDEILLENGYRQYNDTWYNADRLYQKRIKDKKGTKYFINFLSYDLPIFNNEPRYDVRLSSGTKDYDMEIVLFNIDKMSIEDIENNTPLGRLGNPDDIARVALFLDSENSLFITGQDIVVDGGYTLSQE